MPQASKHAEETEIQDTEIDAEGIKIPGRHGRENTTRLLR
jgi:hypothetical protein